MLAVSASEFVKHFGRYKTEVQREPIAITSHGHTSCYVISANEYERLRRSDRQVYSIEDLPEELYQGMLNAKMDPKYDYLNKLLD